MHKIIIVTLIILQNFAGFGQKDNYTMETSYQFTLNTKITSPFPGIIDSLIRVTGNLVAFNDGRYCLMVFRDMKIENPALASMNGEEEADSMFFDLQNKFAYNFKEKVKYAYEQKHFSAIGSDESSMTIKSADTLIQLSNKSDSKSCPSPSIYGFQHGVRHYSTKRFSFDFLSEKKSDLMLSTYVNKCSTFPYSNNKLQFMY